MNTDPASPSLDTAAPSQWHVVLISFYDTVPQSLREDVFQRFQTLGEDCGGRAAGILFWKVDWNLDRRKNVHLVEIAIFKDDAALDHFRRHPKHTELADILRNAANWWVGDIYDPAPVFE